jgi:hypothetical protein
VGGRHLCEGDRRKAYLGHSEHAASAMILLRTVLGRQGELCTVRISTPLLNKSVVDHLKFSTHVELHHSDGQYRGLGKGKGRHLPAHGVPPLKLAICLAGVPRDGRLEQEPHWSVAMEHAVLPSATSKAAIDHKPRACIGSSTGWAWRQGTTASATAN